jgi:hypothetical protein
MPSLADAPTTITVPAFLNADGDPWNASADLTEINEYDAVSPATGSPEAHAAVRYDGTAYNESHPEREVVIAGALAFNRHSYEPIVLSLLDQVFRAYAIYLVGRGRGDEGGIVLTPVFPITQALLMQSLVWGEYRGARFGGAAAIFRPFTASDTVATFDEWIPSIGY